MTLANRIIKCMKHNFNVMFVFLCRRFPFDLNESTIKDDTLSDLRLHSDKIQYDSHIELISIRLYRSEF